MPARETAARLGIKFRAGAFRALLGAPVCTLTDRAIPIADVLGAATSGLETALADPGDVAPATTTADACLLADPPALGGAALLAGEILDAVMSERTLTRVAQVAKRFGLADRALQHLFLEHVGVSPKWVIQRFRLQDAVDQLAAGTAAPGSALALEFRYYDQAHVIRDFTALVGVAPAEYARRSAAYPAE